MRQIQGSTQILAALISSIALVASALAVNEQVTYMHDEHYIYTEQPVPLTFDEEQQVAIKEANKRIIEQLEAINAANPRLTWKQRANGKLMDGSIEFEKNIEEVVGYAQKYYGTIEPIGYHMYNSLPSAYMVFSGIEVTGGMGLSAGGSVMVGVVFVPLHVTRIHIDTGETVEYTTCDTSLVVWPTANVGVGVGGGTNFRGGLGIIWGQLRHASEFRGFVVGVSATIDAAIGLNLKGQFLKNWSKSGAINNFFITAGIEDGPATKLEAHGNASWVIDAGTFFNSVGAGAGAIANKFGLRSEDTP